MRERFRHIYVRRLVDGLFWVIYFTSLLAVVVIPCWIDTFYLTDVVPRAMRAWLLLSQICFSLFLFIYLVDIKLGNWYYGLKDHFNIRGYF